MSDKLTPLDVQNREFPRKFKGYDTSQVDAFLVSVRETLEALYREIDELRQQSRSHADRLSDYQRMEGTLRETLTTAQRMGESIKNSAQKEAQVIIAEAELAAEQHLRVLQSRKAELIAQIHELKRERIQFETRLETLIDLHQRMLEAFKEQESAVEKVEDALTFLPRNRDAAGDE